MKILSATNNYIRETRKATNNSNNSFLGGVYSLDNADNDEKSIPNYKKNVANINSTFMQSKIMNTEKNQSSGATTINRNVDEEYILSKQGKGNIINCLQFSGMDKNFRSVVSNGGSIGYAENFDKENPVIIVRGEDENGFFEAYVDLNKVDPNNCTNIEYEALQGYYTGQKLEEGHDMSTIKMPFVFAKEPNPHSSISSTETYNLKDAYQNAITTGLYDKNSILKEIAVFNNLWNNCFFS